MSLRSWLMIGLVVIGVSGCSGGASGVPKDRPKCTPVSGTLTLDGTPVEGAAVTFHPMQGGHAATGRTDAQGKFVLQTFVEGDGAVPAEYGISVVKLAPSTSTAVSMDDPKYDPNAKSEPPKHLLPEKYAAFAKSGLKETVGSEPLTDVKVELKSK